MTSSTTTSLSPPDDPTRVQIAVPGTTCPACVGRIELGMPLAAVLLDPLRLRRWSP